MKYGVPKIEIKWVLVPFAQGQQVPAMLQQWTDASWVHWMPQALLLCKVREFNGTDVASLQAD